MGWGRDLNVSSWVNEPLPVAYTFILDAVQFSCYCFIMKLLVLVKVSFTMIELDTCKLTFNIHTILLNRSCLIFLPLTVVSKLEWVLMNKFRESTVSSKVDILKSLLVGHFILFMFIFIIENPTIEDISLVCSFPLWSFPLHGFRASDMIY